MVFETLSWMVGEAWRKTCHEIDEFHRVLQGNLSGNLDDWMISRWLPPPQGCAKLNTGGSFRPEN